MKKHPPSVSAAAGSGTQGLPQQKRRDPPERETAFARTGLACSGRGWHGNQSSVLRKLLKIILSYFKQQMVQNSIASQTTSPATRNSLGSRMAWLRPFMNTFALVLMVPDIYFLVSPCQGVRTGRRCGCLKFFSSMKGHRLPAQGAPL